MSRHFAIVLRFALVILTGGAAALAHGGEDHGPPVQGAGASGATEHVYATETELFSLVLKYPVHGEHGRLPLRVYVADAVTSAPIAGATIRLELTGLGDVRATQHEPGIYLADIADPRPGTIANAVVTVEGNQVDIQTLDGLTFGPLRHATATSGHATTPATAQPAAMRARLIKFAAAGLTAMILLGVVVGAIRWRRRNARRAELATPEAHG